MHVLAHMVKCKVVSGWLQITQKSAVRAHPFCFFFKIEFKLKYLPIGIYSVCLDLCSYLTK